MSSPQSDPQRPNIIYLNSHDTGRQIQPYGFGVPTPNLQRLAEGGILFRQAFSAAPTCSPSRAALVTGQYPHECGMVGLAHRNFRLNEYGQHLLHTLRQAGYRSTIIGAQHVARGAQRSIVGYDEIVETEHSHAPYVGPAAEQWLRSRPAEPFYLEVGTIDTHEPFPQVDPQQANYVRVPGNNPDSPAAREKMAGFVELARRLDLAVGQVLDALDETGLADNTLVIATTDHGPSFPGMKCHLTDGGLGVLLIIRWPGSIAGERTIDAMVQQMDLYPTICELLGLTPPSWLRGRSLVPLIRGEAEQLHEELFGESNYHTTYRPMRSIRTQRYKYIRAYPPETARTPPEQLFDLQGDPYESCNRVADPALADVLDNLRQRLDRHMEETADPLLHGVVPKPVDAILDEKR